MTAREVRFAVKLAVLAWVGVGLLVCALALAASFLGLYAALLFAAALVAAVWAAISAGLLHEKEAVDEACCAEEGAWRL